MGFANINAPAETVDAKPAFREAFQQRHCLVPVDNFYEWKRSPAVSSKNWRLAAGEWVRSFAIITTQPNELCAQSHARGLETQGLAGMAWRGTSSRVGARAKRNRAEFYSVPIR